MTDFYRFPAMAKLIEIDPVTQAINISIEANKALAAERGWGLNSGIDVRKNFEYKRAYGMGLMDVIQSAETALRMDFYPEDVAQLRDAVIEKNRKRGYYDE